MVPDGFDMPMYVLLLRAQKLKKKYKKGRGGCARHLNQKMQMLAHTAKCISLSHPVIKYHFTVCFIVTLRKSYI